FKGFLMRGRAIFPWSIEHPIGGCFALTKSVVCRADTLVAGVSKQQWSLKSLASMMSFVSNTHTIPVIWCAVGGVQGTPISHQSLRILGALSLHSDELGMFLDCCSVNGQKSN